MENLGDILKRLDATSGSNGGDHIPPGYELPPQVAACEICNGRGWYTPDLPAGHPDFGAIVTEESQPTVGVGGVVACRLKRKFEARPLSRVRVVVACA